MPDYQSRVPEILDHILQQEIITSRTLCCKLDNIMSALGVTPTSPITTIISGVKKLTGSSTFSTSVSLSGINTYRSISISIISLSSGTVSITDPSGTTSIGYAGLNLNFSIDKSTDGGLAAGLIVTNSGDAITVVSYTGIA